MSTHTRSHTTQTTVGGRPRHTHTHGVGENGNVLFYIFMRTRAHTKPYVLYVRRCNNKNMSSSPCAMCVVMCAPGRQPAAAAAENRSIHQTMHISQSHTRHSHITRRARARSMGSCQFRWVPALRPPSGGELVRAERLRPMSRRLPGQYAHCPPEECVCALHRASSVYTTAVHARGHTI